jgi:hypothetical protein
MTPARRAPGAARRPAKSVLGVSNEAVGGPTQTGWPGCQQEVGHAMCGVGSPARTALTGRYGPLRADRSRAGPPAGHAGRRAERRPPHEPNAQRKAARQRRLPAHLTTLSAVVGSDRQGGCEDVSLESGHISNRVKPNGAQRPCAPRPPVRSWTHGEFESIAKWSRGESNPAGMRPEYCGRRDEASVGRRAVRSGRNGAGGNRTRRECRRNTVADAMKRVSAGGPYGAGEMEPGGIEPPCRDGQQVASTRVVAPLISAQ